MSFFYEIQVKCQKILEIIDKNLNKNNLNKKSLKFRDILRETKTIISQNIFIFFK